MIEALRDPIWNGVSALVAILALIIAAKKDRVQFRPAWRKIVVAIIKILTGILVILPGPSIAFTMGLILEGGLSYASFVWYQEFLNRGGSTFNFDISYAVLPGAVTVLIASQGKTFKESVIFAIIGAFVSTTIVDTYIQIATEGNFMPSLAIAILFNILGSLIAGPIIAYLLSLIDKISDTGLD